MALIPGKDVTVIIGGTTVTANNVIDITMDFTIEKSESTGAGDTWKTFIGGIQKGMSFTINGYYNAGGSAPAGSLRAVLETTLAATNCSAAFDIRRAGTAGAAEKITGTMVLDGISGPTNGLLGTQLISGTFTATGTVSFGTQ